MIYRNECFFICIGCVYFFDSIRFFRINDFCGFRGGYFFYRGVMFVNNDE